MWQNMISQFVRGLANAANGQFGAPMGGILVFMLATLVVRIFNLFRTAGRIVLWTPVWIVGGIAWTLALCGLCFFAGAYNDQKWLMYAALLALTVFAVFMKGIISLLERAAPIVQANVPQALVNRGVHLTQIDLGLQETLTDIAMALLMSSVFVLTGNEIGLTLNWVGWAAIASLVAIVLLSGAPMSIRRPLMTVLTAFFVLAYAVFQISPATREIAKVFGERSQIAQRTVADTLRPSTSVKATEIHQNAQRQVLESELKRFQEETNKYTEIASRRQLTLSEIQAYNQALAGIEVYSKLLYSPHKKKQTTTDKVLNTTVTLIVLLLFGIAMFVILRAIWRSANGSHSNAAAEPTSHGIGWRLVFVIFMMAVIGVTAYFTIFRESQQSADFQVPAGTVIRLCDNCLLTDGQVDIGKVGAATELPFPGWYKPVEDSSPEAVVYQSKEYMPAHPAVNDNPQAGFKPAVVLVAHDAASKAGVIVGAKVFQKWTSYGIPLLLLLFTGLVLFFSTVKISLPSGSGGDAHAHH